MLDKMLKNKTRLALKMFIILWFLLFLQVILKLTFNYWQPYVIPNERLQIISDFIDSHSWTKIILNGILYIFNGIIMILCSIKRWWFKSKKQTIIVVIAVFIGFVYNVITKDSIINTILLSILLPIILDRKKWIYTILTFLLTNLFMILSLFLEGFINSDNMQYVCKIFLQFDYYIMLTLNYFVFNLIELKKERGNL